jgi:hypothetical protein
MWVVTAINSLSLLVFPSLGAMKSNECGLSEQGQIQGALTGVRALSGSLGPLLFGLLWRRFGATAPDIAIYAVAFVSFAALIVGLTVPRPRSVATGDSEGGAVETVGAEGGDCSSLEPVVDIQREYRRLGD